MPKFRNIYVIVPTRHDLSKLIAEGNKIIHCTTGYEQLEEIIPTVLSNAKDFDPDMDAVLAVGKVNWCMLAGIAFAKLAEGQPVTIGSFNNKQSKGVYEWRPIHIG